jgi:hypothetical protein
MRVVEGTVEASLHFGDGDPRARTTGNDVSGTFRIHQSIVGEEAGLGHHAAADARTIADPERRRRAPAHADRVVHGQRMAAGLAQITACARITDQRGMGIVHVESYRPVSRADCRSPGPPTRRAAGESSYRHSTRVALPAETGAARACPAYRIGPGSRSQILIAATLMVPRQTKSRLVVPGGDRAGAAELVDRPFRRRCDDRLPWSSSLARALLAAAPGPAL